MGSTFGRPSPLGNPYSHLPKSAAKFRVNTREEAIEKYREWLRGQLLDETSRATQMLARIIEKYLAGEDICLICHCKPLPPHGDVVRNAIIDIVKRKEQKGYKVGK